MTAHDAARLAVALAAYRAACTAAREAEAAYVTLERALASIEAARKGVPLS